MAECFVKEKGSLGSQLWRVKGMIGMYSSRDEPVTDDIMSGEGPRRVMR